MKLKQDAQLQKSGIAATIMCACEKILS
jgi:hypothetical protein